MKVYEVSERPAVLVQELLKVWEKSVRATHLFLSDEEVKNIKNYVPQALSGIAHLLIAENEAGTGTDSAAAAPGISEAGMPVAFMGIEDGVLEMLFITPEVRGQGLGKQLIRYGIENYGVDRLAVNEQNPQAKGFYEHMGFKVYKRTETDEQGNPYPLLYMNRK